jgi:hypothetical protein
VKVCRTFWSPEETGASIIQTMRIRGRGVYQLDGSLRSALLFAGKHPAPCYLDFSENNYF